MANLEINMLGQFYCVSFVLIYFLMQCQLVLCTHHGNIVKRMDMDIATCLGKLTFSIVISYNKLSI